MQRFKYNITISIALFAGAILLLSCGSEGEVKPTFEDPETQPTMVSYNHTMVETQDGKLKYRMTAPVVEKFDEAREPYMEFKKGVKGEKFFIDENDPSAAAIIESDIVADYVIYNETQRLWDARGNVIARNLLEDKTLYTDQLFWNEKEKKIYTDKPARVVDRGNTHLGTGFEADEKFEQWQFNRARGQIEVDTTRSNESDSMRAVNREKRSYQRITPGAAPR